jgi:hypothetical protein
MATASLPPPADLRLLLRITTSKAEPVGTEFEEWLPPTFARGIKNGAAL